MIRFTLFGFPVSIHWMFWLICALLSGYIDAGTPEKLQRLVAFLAAACISILIHELGHTFMMRRYGAKAQIMLVGMGGLAIPDRGFNRRQHIIVSLAGPLVQIVIGMLARQLFMASSGDVLFVQAFFTSFIWVSLVWGIFNLIPIYPMDGGQVLYYMLGPQLAKTTYVVGIVCAGLGALYFLSLGSRTFITALFLGSMAYENFQRYRGDRPQGFLYPN